MNDLNDLNGAINRRQFFRKGGFGLGVAALGSLLGENALAGEPAGAAARPLRSAGTRRIPSAAPQAAARR